ncbi:MAG: hypothetical protein AB8H80_18130 [Planctomycetota bacterium]
MQRGDATAHIRQRFAHDRLTARTVRNGRTEILRVVIEDRLHIVHAGAQVLRASSTNGVERREEILVATLRAQRQTAVAGERIALHVALQLAHLAIDGKRLLGQRVRRLDRKQVFMRSLLTDVTKHRNHNVQNQNR